jgi:putative flippase GtrA
MRTTVTRKAATVPAAAGLIQRFSLLSTEFCRYLLASVVALAADFGLLWLLTEKAGVHYLTSAALSYTIGGVLHYWLSVNLVFRHRRFSDQKTEFAAFFLIGLLGLSVNELVLNVAVEHLGQSYMIGKAAAAGVGFVITFVTRRAALFASRRILA